MLPGLLGCHYFVKFNGCIAYEVYASSTCWECLPRNFFFAVANSAGAARKSAGAVANSAGAVANSVGAATKSAGAVANSVGAAKKSAAVVVRFVLIGTALPHKHSYIV